MYLSLPILGIDVDKEFLVVNLLHEGGAESRSFKNNQTGVRDMIRWFKALGFETVLVCLEATGRYGELVARILYDEGHKVCVVNPAWICSHKEALNRTNKTDPKDAEAIADYARCFSNSLRLWQPMDVNRLRLRDVVGQIRLLTKTITTFSNRSDCGLEFDEVKRSNDEAIAHLVKQLDEMKQIREQLYDSLPELNELRELLDSVPGIGHEIADALIVKVDFENFESGRQLACYLGCSSSEWKSGKQQKKGKQKKTGDRGLRALIRQGASAGLRSNFFREIVQSHRQKGLSDGQIVGVIARKMILIAHAVVRNRKAFDPLYLHPLAFRNLS